jgi:hypothetical protein
MVRFAGLIEEPAITSARASSPMINARTRLRLMLVALWML